MSSSHTSTVMRPVSESCCIPARCKANDNDIVLPEWLTNRAPYVPDVGRKHFIQHNLLHFGRLLVRIKSGGHLEINDDCIVRLFADVHPGIRLIGLVVTIACINLTQNMLFSYVVFAVVLAALAVRPMEDMVQVLKPSVTTALLGVVLVLPSAMFAGQWSIMSRIGVRTFIVVSITVSLSRSMSWNDLFSGLSWIKCPDVIIHMVDITLQFIAILGGSVIELLEALVVRSVGRDSKSLTSSGNLLGVVFLRSHRHALEMSDAMICRGFSGSYHMRSDKRYSIWKQAIYVAVGLVMIAIAVYLK